jgi:hypothetical protein
VRTFLIRAETASHAQAPGERQNIFTVFQLRGSLRQRQKRKKGRKRMQVKRRKKKLRKERRNEERNTRQNPVASTEYGCCGNATSFVTNPIDLNE